MKKLYDTSVSGQTQENYYMCDDLEDGEMSCPQLHLQIQCYLSRT